MMLTPLTPRRRQLLAIIALLALPLAIPAQFTGIAIASAHRPRIAVFSTTVGDALDTAFNQPDGLDGSFGTLDRGFGTYLAPRTDPRQRHPRIYLNPAHADGTSGPRGGT